MPSMVRRTMPPVPTHYGLDDTITFDAQCPTCGGECSWTSTRGKGYSDMGSVVDVPIYNRCPREESSAAQEEVA